MPNGRRVFQSHWSLRTKVIQWSAALPTCSTTILWQNSQHAFVACSPVFDFSVSLGKTKLSYITKLILLTPYLLSLNLSFYVSSASLWVVLWIIIKLWQRLWFPTVIGLNDYNRSECLSNQLTTCPPILEKFYYFFVKMFGFIWSWKSTGTFSKDSNLMNFDKIVFHTLMHSYSLVSSFMWICLIP